MKGKYNKTPTTLGFYNSEFQYYFLTGVSVTAVAGIA